MRVILHVVEVNDRDKSIGMLSVILAAFGAPNFERIVASFVETDKSCFLFMLLTEKVDSVGVFLLAFHRIYY